MKIIFLLLFFITSVQLLAQDSTCYECCVYKNKFSSGQRIKFYPFNVVDTIKIVSFKYHWNNYHFSDSGLNNDSLIESHILSDTEINELTDILFNNSRKRKSNIGSVTMCFEPRNAILFIDKEGKLIENILICFHCNRIELSSDKMYNFDQCSGKISLLLNYFKKAGIKIGTDLSINFYEGETPKTDVIAPPLNN